MSGSVATRGRLSQLQGARAARLVPVVELSPPAPPAAQSVVPPVRKRTISAGRKGAKPQHYADERAINVVMFAAEKKRYWAAKLALLNADRFPDYAHEGLVVPPT